MSFRIYRLGEWPGLNSVWQGWSDFLFRHTRLCKCFWRTDFLEKDFWQWGQVNRLFGSRNKNVSYILFYDVIMKKSLRNGFRLTVGSTMRSHIWSVSKRSSAYIAWKWLKSKVSYCFPPIFHKFSGASLGENPTGKINGVSGA